MQDKSSIVRDYMSESENMYSSTLFEGTSNVLESHEEVVSFIIEGEFGFLPEDFLDIIDAFLMGGSPDFVDDIIDSDVVKFVDFLRLSRDLMSLYHTNTMELDNSDDPWKEYIHEVHSVENVPNSLAQTISHQFIDSFDHPKYVFEMKLVTVEELIGVLSYGDSEPSVGDYFVYEAVDDKSGDKLGHIYGRITEQIEPDEEIIEANYYSFNVLAYDTTAGSHEFVEQSEDVVIKPHHSEDLTLQTSNALF